MCKIVNFYLKLKQRQHILKLLFYCSFILVNYFALAQDQIGNSITIDQDSTLVTISRDDSSQSFIRGDSILIDSSARQTKQESDIENTINYSARDSMLFDVESQIMHMYGDAHVDYGSKQLNADYIQINWGTNNVVATYSKDTSDNKIGVPKFDDNGDVYNADTIMYNFDTEKGYISGIETKQEAGLIRGEESFKTPDNTIYIHNGEYCPCDDPEAATVFRSKRIKVVPEKKVYTGPGVMYVDNVPTPLVVPFGIFPANNSKSSGLIPPIPGETPERGFYLRDLGYYWAVNDYIGATFLTEYYSKGGGGYGAQIEYKSRYSFNGKFDYSYRNVVRDGDGYNREEQIDYRVKWKHQPKSFTGKTFSADVNFASTDFNRRNELEIDRNLTSNLNSNISYAMPIRKTPFNLSLNLRHDQNNQTEIVNIYAPDLNIGMSQLKPFKSQKAGKKSEVRKLYESVSIRYTGNIKTRFTNEINQNQRFGVSNVYGIEKDTVFPFKGPNMDAFWANNGYAMSHSIPVTATMKLGPVSANPNFSYNETWYPQKYDYTYRTQDTTVAVDTVANFGRAYNWNTGISFDTRFYSTYSYKGERQKKLRHVLNPNINFRYQPDRYSDTKQYQQVQYNEKGDYKNISRHHSIAGFSAPGGNEAASIGFGIRNDFELKYTPLKDTTGKAKYIKLLENVFANSNYDFLKDSFNLANFRVGANTSLIKGISLQWTGDLNPYSYRVDSINGNGEVVEQQILNDFAINNNQGLGFWERHSFVISGRFSPRTFKRNFKTNKGTEEEIEKIKDEYGSNYVDFTLPWAFHASYNLQIRKIGFAEPVRTKSLNFGGELKLSDFWKITGDMAFDFENNQLVSPRFTIYRDLNCWEFNIFWVPFGSSQQYEFRINMKPAALKDLKLTRKRNIRDI